MGLRINQNIAALNAARNLRITDGSMSRSLERLSSGFRINRAADDPAGLIISENLRAQVAGLGQAIRNSQTAVNLIKTAEASLDEALKQLRSIRTLALDALNTGAADSVALAADQTAISSSINSLTRIGQNTQFGKIKLLDGSAGITGSTSDSTVLSFLSATEKTQSGTFTVTGITAATKGTISRTINNEFEIAKAGGTAGHVAIKLATTEVATFKVDFGVGIASSSDVAALGADLKAAGVATAAVATGITITFDETNATAYVSVDATAAGLTVADDVSNTLLTALNNSTLGKVVTFNEDTGDAEKIIATSKFAGLGFSASNVSAADGTNSALKAYAGLGTNATQITATNAITDPAAGETVSFKVQFGNGLTASEAEGLGKALRAGGVKDATVTGAAAGSSVKVALNETTAEVTITITEASAGFGYFDDGAGANGNKITAALTTDLNKAALGIGRFVAFDAAQNATTKFKVTVAFGGVKFVEVAKSGFANEVSVNGANPTIAAAEVDDLGDGLAYSASLTSSTQVAQAANAVKLLQETLTFNGDKVVTISSGTLIVNLANVLNQQLDSLTVGVDASFTSDTDDAASKGSKLTLTNDAFGSSAAAGGKNTVSSNRSDLLNPHLNVGGLDVTIEGANIIGSLNGKAATGVGQTLTLSSSGDNADGLSVRFTGTVDPTGLTVTVKQGSLTFQVGSNSAQTVSQALPDVRSAQLGKTATGLKTTAKSIADINVTTGDGAADALKLVDAAIDQVTTARGNLGAFQANVLESTIASLGVAQENLAAAESAVRDADFAEETVQFTRNQILLQAGTAILTQANAIPQAVLQLLR